jgi:hypothetical protein
MTVTVKRSCWSVAGFAALSLLGLLSHAASSDQQTSGWRFEAYSDPLHRGGSIAKASQVSTRTGSGGTLTVLVRCWSATRELDLRFTTTGQPIESERVSWQFDNQVSRTGDWRISQNRFAVVVPERMRADFLRELRAYRRLTLVLDPDQTFNVPLGGSSEAIAKVQRVCR